MKVNEKVLSIPPYISTGWQNITALHVKETQLVVTLKEGHSISIPHLPQEILDQVFKFHALFVESENAFQNYLTKRMPPMAGPIPSPMPMGDGMQIPIMGFHDGLGNIMQHNPAQSDAPDIPLPILQKIGAIAKIVAPEELKELPKAEPHCNCMHCQIARVMNHAVDSTEPQVLKIEEEQVSEKDLAFQQWEIKPETDKMFSVSNRLDTTERYQVYLDPVGCTCGNHGCEHVIAVLKS